MENVAIHGADRPRVRAVRQALGLLLLLLVVASAPGCVHPQAVRGRHALDERAFGVASAALEAAVRDRPNELSYWVDLGRAYVGKGDATGAVRAFEQASLLAPEQARIQIYLGHAHELARDYDRAELCYRHAVTLEPKRAWPLRVLGARLLRFQHFEAAADALTRATELDPGHAETYNALGIALSKSGETARAELTFRAAITRFPEERRFRLGLAALYANEGRARDALGIYDTLAQRWPSFAEVHVARSILLAELGDRAQAARAMEQALRLAPHNADIKRRLNALKSAP